MGASRTPRHMHALALFAAIAACATVATPLAHGEGPIESEATLGSTTLGSDDATAFGIKKTTYQQAASSELLIAPANGTITQWQVRSDDIGAQYKLRILRPLPDGTLLAAGTSATEEIPDGEDVVRSYSVNRPVKAGDRIGLYVLSGNGAPVHLIEEEPADILNYLDDPFEDGTAQGPALMKGDEGQELLLQATFTLGPPVNVKPPAISGQARRGTLLTGAEGTWESASEYAFRWLRCTGAECAAIEGATETTYTPGPADEGHTLRLEVTATGPTGKTAIAESEPTAAVEPEPVIQKGTVPPGPPIPVLASFAVAPNPTCTGIPTVLDASASSTLDPPLTYSYTIKPFPDLLDSKLAAGGGIGAFEQEIARFGDAPFLAASSNPRQTVEFTWDRAYEERYDKVVGAKASDYARDPVRITLTVTDRTGQTSTSSQDIVFAQLYSSASRSACPAPPASVKTKAFALSSAFKLKLSAGSLTQAIHCSETARCPGAVSIVQRRKPAAHGAARSHASRSPVVIASDHFFSVAAGSTATVAAKLSPAGKRLLAHGRSVTATERLSSIASSGRLTTRSFAVKLRGR